MALPPVEVGYWAAGVVGCVVLTVFVAIVREHLAIRGFDRTVEREMAALIGPVTDKPTVVFEYLHTDFTFQTSHWCTYTCGDPREEIMTRLERNLIVQILAPADLEVDYHIPRGAHTVSFAFDGFSFGTSCLDFRPTFEPEKNAHWRYQMMCSRVQNVYLVENTRSRLAGTCLYFGRTEEEEEKLKEDEQAAFNEYEYNIFKFYEIIKQKRKEEADERRKSEKEEEKRKRREEEPTREFTSSTRSHLRLCTEQDGRPVVLARNADGKNEKYAFNEKEKRYEYVETEADDEEVDDEEGREGDDNYMLRVF